MSPERFGHLLSLVEPKICKEDTAFRRDIPAADRMPRIDCTIFSNRGWAVIFKFFVLNRKVNSE